MRFNFSTVVLRKGVWKMSRNAIYRNPRRGGLSACAGIFISGYTDLHIIRKGNLRAQRYADNIRRPQVVPYAANIGDFFLKMQDNARLHTVRIEENFLEAEKIQLISTL
ncbi:hypothetical protein TNCV_678981 [Trichonephila clavipes]|nr:hypothetical protein TNCV_678981 [Trichonephila clavipes]